jgi:elongation factor G
MVYDAQHIRNVVLLGHAGSGKTSFAECMLYEAKAIPRRGKTEDGNTVSDFTQIEQTRRNSIFSTLMHVDWKDCKINLLDTPGADDFVGEVVSAMKVADTAVMMLNGRSGVEVGTELIWDYIQTNRTPTLFVINHLDNPQADYDTTLEQAKERFGKNVLAVQYPSVLAQILRKLSMFCGWWSINSTPRAANPKNSASLPAKCPAPEKCTKLLSKSPLKAMNH